MHSPDAQTETKTEAGAQIAALPPPIALIRRMSGRDINDRERVSSALELLFDLSTMVAVGTTTAALHHAMASGHYWEGATGFVQAFFAIWWSWMTFAWFSSAHDTDDVPYRFATAIQMIGVLLIAIGIGLPDDRVLLTSAIGFCVMRLGLIALWLRAAFASSNRRTTCLRYAGGLVVLQMLWMLRLAILPPDWILPSFVLFAALEMLLPVWSEQAGNTPWHPNHIAERYGLFTIILLGECMIGAGNAMGGILSARGWSVDLVLVSVSTVGLIFGIWWAYFLVPFAQVLRHRRERAFSWGYGHALVFFWLTLLGAVYELVADVLAGHPSPTGQAGEGVTPLDATILFAFAANAIMATLWWLGGHTTRRIERSAVFLLPGLVASVLGVTGVALGWPMPAMLLPIAASPALLVVAVMLRRRRHPERFAVR